MVINRRRALELSALLAVSGSGCMMDESTEEIGSSTLEVVINDDRWELARSIVFDNPQGAHYNPIDDRIYAGRRGTVTDGIYRIDADGTSLRIGNASNPAAVMVNPTDGNIFYTEDFGGFLYRKLINDTVPSNRTVWLSQFNSGPIESSSPDDDPVGMAVAPPDYLGPLLAPGEAIVVDRGSGGPDDFFGFSTNAPGERLLRPDDGIPQDVLDVAVSQTSIYLADAVGRIYEMGAGGVLTQLAITPPLPQPMGIAIDPLNGGLLVIDATLDAVISVDLDTLEATPALTGLNIHEVNWAGIDTSPDGELVVVTEAALDRVHVFLRDYNQAPVALCAPQLVNADDACQADAIVDAGSSDPDGDALTIVQSPAGPYPLGDTTVTLTVTDPDGAQASCVTTVTVQDVTAPVVACNAAAEIELNAVPASFAAAATDNCGAGAPAVSAGTCDDPTVGECRPGGDCAIATGAETATITGTGGVGTIFTWQAAAADSSGNVGSAVCQVTVVPPPDGVPPCNGAPVAVCTPQVIAADGACQGDVSVDGGSTDPDGDPITVTQSPAGPYPLGETVVTLTVTDPDGAVGACSTTVTVQDVTPPVVACNAAPAIDADDDGQSFTATATDNCGVAPPVVENAECVNGRRAGSKKSCAIQATGDTATITRTGPVGSTFSWDAVATDGAGNAVAASCETTVVVSHGGGGHGDDDVESDGCHHRGRHHHHRWCPWHRWFRHHWPWRRPWHRRHW